MEYFCYISRDKVDQILAAGEEFEVLETAEQSAQTDSRQRSAGLAIASLVKADIAYGRTDVLQRNRKLKETYAGKLKRALQRIQPNVLLFDGTPRAASRNALTYYFYNGQFRLHALDAEHLMATLRADLTGCALLLDCSLHYFSSDPVRDGRPHITSTNYALFQRGFSFDFETVFLLTGRHEFDLVGSPLYLKMRATPGLLL